MRIFVDENIPKITVRELKAREHNVVDIRNTEQEGIPDKEVWANAQEQKRLLITTDKGFFQYRNVTHFGIIIIRLKKPNRIKIHERILYAITRLPESDWQNKIVMIKDNVLSSWKNTDPDISADM